MFLAKDKTKIFSPNSFHHHNSVEPFPRECSPESIHQAFREPAAGAQASPAERSHAPLSSHCCWQ